MPNLLEAGAAHMVEAVNERARNMRVSSRFRHTLVAEAVVHTKICMNPFFGGGAHLSDSAEEVGGGWLGRAKRAARLGFLIQYDHISEAKPNCGTSERQT